MKICNVAFLMRRQKQNNVLQQRNNFRYYLSHVNLCSKHFLNLNTRKRERIREMNSRALVDYGCFCSGFHAFRFPLFIFPSSSQNVNGCADKIMVVTLHIHLISQKRVCFSFTTKREIVQWKLIIILATISCCVSIYWQLK